jgi:predicted nucleotidyltransferase
MGSLSKPISDFRFAVSAPDEVREVAAALIEALGHNLAALLWHGSWARGEQTPESDHDMIVVLKQIDGDVLTHMRDVFTDRTGWSTYVKTEEELRQYPTAGRLQFHHGFIALHGSFEAPPVTREGLLEELRRLAVDIQHEARYRIIHGTPRVYEGLNADFVRVRNARWMYYQAKMAILAMKSREVLRGAAHPATRAELRSRLSDTDEIALIDTVERWSELKSQYELDYTPLAFLLDRVCRRLVHELDSGRAQ